MKTAILLHGRPDHNEYYDVSQSSASNGHWFPWLQKQLLAQDIHAQTPEVPFAFEPQWDLWVKEVERFEINEDTILVGHSTGGGFWVRYLSDHPELRVGKVVLVAPWIDVEKAQSPEFFNFEIDPELVSRTKGITILASSDDMDMITSSVQELENKIKNVEVIRFSDKGHFCESDLGTKDFPELLDVILR